MDKEIELKQSWTGRIYVYLFNGVNGFNMKRKKQKVGYFRFDNYYNKYLYNQRANLGDYSLGLILDELKFLNKKK